MANEAEFTTFNITDDQDITPEVRQQAAQRFQEALQYNWDQDGKSEFIDQIMINIAKDKGWKFGICSFENEPRIHIEKLISKYVGKPFFDGLTPRLNNYELDQGKKFIQSHFSFLYQADGSLSSLDSIMERMKVAVMRHGVRGVVILDGRKPRAILKEIFSDQGAGTLIRK